MGHNEVVPLGGHAGRIYKLRRPSSKHLSSAPGYVSANPTHDWGFPIIITEAEETETESENTASMLDTSKSSVDMVVSKPFIPNTGHWKFQPVALTKVRLVLYFKSVGHVYVNNI